MKVKVNYFFSKGWHSKDLITAYSTFLEAVASFILEDWLEIMVVNSFIYLLRSLMFNGKLEADQIIFIFISTKVNLTKLFYLSTGEGDIIFFKMMVYIVGVV